MDTPHESGGKGMAGEPPSRQEDSAALARESALMLARSHWVKEDQGFFVILVARDVLEGPGKRRGLKGSVEFGAEIVAALVN